MHHSSWRLADPHAFQRMALIGFPPENKLTGTTLLRLSALRRSVVSAAHMLMRETQTLVVANSADTDSSNYILDPVVERKIYPLDLGFLGATNIPVISREGVQLVDFTFNAWGEEDLPHRHDSRFPTWLSRNLGTAQTYSMLNFSASDMATDGHGTMVLSEMSLLSPLRNPGWDKKSIERELTRTLGAKRFAWVAGRARASVYFVDGRTALVQLPQESDIYFEEAVEVAATIEGLRTAQGGIYDVHIIPPSVSKQSYLDATRVNGTILIPKYGEDSDAQSLQVYSELHPHLKVQQVETKPLAQRGLSWADVILLIPKAPSA